MYLISQNFTRMDQPGNPFSAEEKIMRILQDNPFNANIIDVELENMKKRFAAEERRLLWFIGAVVVMLIIMLIVFLFFFNTDPQSTGRVPL